MLLRLLLQLDVKEIWLAGMDGYSPDARDNYAQEELELPHSREALEAMNRGMNQVLAAYAQQVPLHFLTKPRHVHAAPTPDLPFLPEALLQGTAP